MGLQPGTKLGPYEIVAAIGAGGMGEVYRAKDSRLGRDVAIKVMPTCASLLKESKWRLGIRRDRGWDCTRPTEREALRRSW
jgi:eukaryotic-like serine/threonine-protein kinase